MKLIGKAITSIVRNDAELSSVIGRAFFNSVAPQTQAAPYVVGRVTAVEPVDSKASGIGRGRACTDVMYYTCSVFSFDPETSALIASKLRKALDRPRPGVYAGIQLNNIVFMGAEESGVAGDDAEMYIWDVVFQVRVDFSTDDI